MHNTAVKKSETEFRDYRADNIRDSVKKLYYLNHTQQTVDFVRSRQKLFYPLQRDVMGVWETLEKLNTLVDDSDPDTALSQTDHALQSAEAARRDGRPDWFILTALIHDIGKALCFYDEPQWAVVGDTFPVGCQFSSKIVYPEYFAENPDSKNPLYQTELGIYKKHCGLNNVLMSWGHDEYGYQVVKDYLPEEAAYIIRYHSFYPCHRDNAYLYLLNEHDTKMIEWVKEFNQYDLYSKADALPDLEKLKPYYQALIRKYFPAQIRW